MWVSQEFLEVQAVGCWQKLTAYSLLWAKIDGAQTGFEWFSIACDGPNRWEGVDFWTVLAVRYWTAQFDSACQFSNSFQIQFNSSSIQIHSNSNKLIILAAKWNFKFLFMDVQDYISFRYFQFHDHTWIDTWPTTKYELDAVHLITNRNQ